MYLAKDVAYYSHTRHELLPFTPSGLENALDVGCGTGNFGQLLKKSNPCSVWGIEPDERSAKEAALKLDRVINAQFDQNIHRYTDKKFDAIFFNDVLEHFAQPDEALRLAADLLTENGTVVASIPNIRFYPVMLSLIRYKDFKYLDAGVMDKTHLRFFTQKSMIRLFEENGFAVEKAEGINKHRFKYLDILNACFFNRLWDMKYPQFAIVAKLKR